MSTTSYFNYSIVSVQSFKCFFHFLVSKAQWNWLRRDEVDEKLSHLSKLQMRLQELQTCFDTYVHYKEQLWTMKGQVEKLEDSESEQEQ